MKGWSNKRQYLPASFDAIEIRTDERSGQNPNLWETELIHLFNLWVPHIYSSFCSVYLRRCFRISDSMLSFPTTTINLKFSTTIILKSLLSYLLKQKSQPWFMCDFFKNWLNRSIHRNSYYILIQNNNNIIFKIF